jgi:ABC-type lipoprotein export system ATPase subunit/ABC-type antimicrobial peptide transport system permease subunit
MSGLDNYEEGEMYLFNEETSHFSVDDWEKYRSSHIGFISQNYNLIESYTVFQNILLALELQNYPKEDRKSRAIELINMVGLERRIHHKAGKLSGGEKQRTVIARALAKDASVIICDEPTGNLDSKSSESIIALIKSLGKDKLILFVTHNYDEVEHAATRRIRLRDGEVIEDQVIKKYEPTSETKKIEIERKIPFLTLLNSSIRTLFATPKRLLFTLSLQIIIISIFIFIRAFLLSSSDLLVGDLAGDNDSSHLIEIVKRDESKISDLSEFEHNELIKSVVKYDMVYAAYQAIGKVDEENLLGSYPLGEINMNDAAVLNKTDLFEGSLPRVYEVVLSTISMELYDLKVGDQVSLLRVYTSFEESIGDIYTISGTTQLGNSQSVYFHSSLFKNKEQALHGLIAVAGKSIKYRHYTPNPLSSVPPVMKYSQMEIGKFIFDDTLNDWEVVIPEGLWPVQDVITSIDIGIGSYYGEGFSFLDVSMDNVTKAILDTNNVYLSTTYQEAFIEHFFGDDYLPTKVILNVHDITDGKEVSKSLDHEIFRVYYHVSVLNSEEALLTQKQFNFVSFVVVLIAGSLLYTILGVVLGNINKAKRRDFTIMRSIGANRSYLAKQVVIEQVISGVIAFIFVVIFFYVLGAYNYTVSETMRHIEFSQYLVLFVLSILLSVQVSLRFNKKIFNFSIISSLNESEGAK